MSGDDESLPTGGGGESSKSLVALVRDSDHILSEFLLRLPPVPSSLPRATAVCKRWEHLVSDPGFHRRFRARHRDDAPVVGFFTQAPDSVSFTPTLEPPDRLPQQVFPWKLDDGYWMLGCRHGLVLFLNRFQLQVLVWNPATGDVVPVALPPGFSEGGIAMAKHGAVLRDPSDHGDGDYPIPFFVALFGHDQNFTRAYACVYSSETGVWSNLISTECVAMVPMPNPGILFGGSLYWLLGGKSCAMLKFDLDGQRLTVIDDIPLEICTFDHRCHWITPVEGGDLGLHCVSGYSAHLWTRKIDSNGVAGWVLQRSIDLEELLSLDCNSDRFPPWMCGFAEEDNVSFIATDAGLFLVKLDSMQFKKLSGMAIIDNYYPFAGVCTAGIKIGGGHGGVDLLQNA